MRDEQPCQCKSKNQNSSSSDVSDSSSEKQQHQQQHQQQQQHLTLQGRRDSARAQLRRNGDLHWRAHEPVVPSRELLVTVGKRAHVLTCTMACKA
jgi:hypothetical protein